MQIRHKESGKVLEVMDGTKFAESAYELVKSKKPAADKVEGDTKKKATTKKPAADKVEGDTSTDTTTQQ